MRKIAVCPNCKGIDSVEEEHSLNCSGCKIALVPTGFTNEEWRMLSYDQKDKAIAQALGEDSGTVLTAENPSSETPMEAMQKDIKTIKNILVFYLIISIIGAIFIVASIFPLLIELAT